MRLFGILLQAVGTILTAVGLADGLGFLVSTLRRADALVPYAFLSTPIALVGIVPGILLFLTGRRLKG